MDSISRMQDDVLDSILSTPDDALDSTTDYGYWKAVRARAVATRMNGSLRQQGLPFGSDTLVRHPFPGKYGFSVNYHRDSVNDDTTLAHQAALYSIWKYYLKLHPQEEDWMSDLLWRVRSMNWLTIGSGGSYPHPEMFSVSNGTMWYSIALPRLGRYEMYYASEMGNEWGCVQPYLQNYHSICCWGRDFRCNANGALILYDRKQEHANVIHAYFLREYGELGYRFFYITGQGRIRIFDGVDNEQEIWTHKHAGRWYYLRESYELRVRHNGKIEIREKIEY